jgi:hypothetical protein
MTYLFTVLSLKQHFFCFLQNLVESLSAKNSVLENELTVARKSSDGTMKKLKDVEGKCNQLQQNLDKYVFLSLFNCIKLQDCWNYMWCVNVTLSLIWTM